MEKRVAMNARIKELIQQLGEAIHESVSESEQISGVVREIREEGFDVLLMLEATIGLNEVTAEEDEADESNPGRALHAQRCQLPQVSAHLAAGRAGTDDAADERRAGASR